MPRNKLGLHHGLGGRDTKRWMLESRPTVMKFVADLGASTEAPPDILCVGRVVDDGAFFGNGFDANRMEQSIAPKDAAAQYVEFLRDKIRLNPRIDIWEFANEQVITSQDVMAWYGAACHEFARLIQQLGKRAGLGGWAVGTPRFDLWPFYTLALQATVDFDAVLTRHEYGPLNGFLGLRYRVDQSEFTKLGYPNVPLVISECGGDNVPGSGPWKLFYKTIDRYWDELLHPYALALSDDPYVIGATVFTCGGGWQDFDVSGSGLVDKVIAFANSLPEPIEDNMDLAKIKADLKIASDARGRAAAEIQTVNDALARITSELNTPNPLEWWEIAVLPFVTVVKMLPLTTYKAPGGVIHDVRPGATYDLVVTERVKINSEGWLKVSPIPLWVKANDVRLK